MEDPENLELIERFIEVKSGPVIFTTNEWEHAKRRKDKYYLYKTSLQEVVVIPNPTKHHYAIRQIKQNKLNINKIENNSKYTIKIVRNK